MFQLYPIYEPDVQEAYRKLNAFLAELSALDIDVPLENIRTNTKFYPDYQQTATTIEVAVEMSGTAVYALAPKIIEAHEQVVCRSAEIPAPVAETAVYPLEHAPVAEKLPDALTIRDFDPFLDADDMP